MGNLMVVWLCMTMYDYVWLCMTVYDYVWLCMTWITWSGRYTIHPCLEQIGPWWQDEEPTRLSQHAPGRCCCRHLGISWMSNSRSRLCAKQWGLALQAISWGMLSRKQWNSHGFLLTLTRQVISVTEGVRNQRFVDWMRQQIRVPETLSYMWVMWLFLKRLPFSTMSIHFLQLWYWLQQASSTAQLAEGPWPIRWAFEQGPDCPGRDWLEVLWAVDILGLEMGWMCLKMGDTIFEWGKWSWTSWTTGALFSGTHTHIGCLMLFDVVCCWNGFPDFSTTGRFPASNMDVQKKLVGCSDADEPDTLWSTIITLW